MCELYQEHWTHAIKLHLQLNLNAYLTYLQRSVFYCYKVLYPIYL